MTTTTACVCGHDEARHEHYRNGTDCVVCGCMTYRTPTAVSVTVTVGWLLILASAVLFWGAVVWGFTKWLGAL